MAKSTHASARPEQLTQSLAHFLNEDVLIWLDTSADSLAELADLLRTIKELSKTSGNTQIAHLASLGVRIAEDYANCVNVCAEELRANYLEPQNGGAA